MVENLNKEREGRTDKVTKSRKKEIAREFLSLHPCLSKLKKKKRISQLWILG